MIAKNEVLFEKYRIALKQDKDAIDIEGEDAINRNQLFLISFQECSIIEINYMRWKKSLLIGTILTYHLRENSAKENSSEPSTSRKENYKENTPKPSPSRKESIEENTSKPSPSRKYSAKENTSKPSPKKGCFVDETNITSQANSDSY